MANETPRMRALLQVLRGRKRRRVRLQPPRPPRADGAEPRREAGARRRRGELAIRINLARSDASCDAFHFISFFFSDVVDV